jgi:hypothetical protein
MEKVERDKLVLQYLQEEGFGLAASALCEETGMTSLATAGMFG